MYSTIYVDDIREIKEENPFESMMSRFDRAAQLLNLDPGPLCRLESSQPGVESTYRPVRWGFRADSGLFEGFRVQHNFAVVQPRAEYAMRPT